MEIYQLEVFVCAARSLSFSKTAEEIHISQPSVSAHISSLEKKLGVQLFIRNSKGVSLTKAGTDFLVYAQKILSLRDHAVHTLNGDDQNINGTIDIISSTIPAQYLLPEIIPSFRKLWPNIVFRVEQAGSRKVEQEMIGFRYDFGMVGTAPDTERFNSCPVYNDELVLILPKDAPQKTGLIRKNFSNFILQTPFIMRETGSGTRAEIESLFSKIGIDPRNLRIPAYFSDANSILSAVANGMGVSLVSKVAASMFTKAGLLTAIEMKNPLFRRQIYLLYNKERLLSPVQQAFADYTRHFYH